MTIDVAMVGAGGHCCSLIPIVNSMGYHIRSVIDKPKSNNEVIYDIPISDMLPEHVSLIISIGCIKRRLLIFNQYKSFLLQDNLVHTTAYVDRAAMLSLYNQIFAISYIGPSAQVGNFNIINTNAIIEHNTVVGNYNHISVGAKLLGAVHIGDRCFIGAGSIIKEKISICNDVIIGANSFITQDITIPGTYVGQASGVRRINE